MAKYVELSVEYLRTRVQFPPSPPTNKNDTPAVSFLFVDCDARESNPRPVRARGEQGIRAALLRACERRCACRRVGWPGWPIPSYDDTLAVSFLFVGLCTGIECASGTDAGWRALNKQHLRAVCSPERHSPASECAACKANSHNNASAARQNKSSPVPLVSVYAAVPTRPSVYALDNVTFKVTMRHD